MTFLSDVRVALRSLLRRPAFTALAVLILGLGIGANTAIFSLVDAVLLRGLDRDADRVVLAFADGRARGQNPNQALTAGDFLDWRDQQQVFSGLAALRNESRRITSVETPVVPLVHAVTANYFDVVGARPLLGRGFVAGEDAPGRDAVVVLAYGVWQSVFGGDPGVVGRQIQLDERSHTVIGVMGPDFYSVHAIAIQPGLWVPTPIESLRGSRATRDLLAYGRLAPNQTLASAQTALQAIAARLAAQYPDTNDRWSAALVPLRQQAVGSLDRTFGMLLAAVGLVLLIACANVANLTLGRASERAQEIATRTALGASSGRIVGQMLAESLVLSLFGGGLGLAIAYFGAAPLAGLIPAQAGVPFLDRVGVSAGVLGFTLLVSVVSAALVALVPARQATRFDLVTLLREGGRGAISVPGRRLRDVLVVSEVALAVVIVSAAGLMLRTYGSLQQVAPGYDAARLLKLRTSLRGDDFQTAAARIAHFDELGRRLQALPGVSAASGISFEPPIVTGAGVFGNVRLALPGVPDDAASAPSAVARAVLPDYFTTVGMPQLAGRGVTRDDTPAGQRVAVISQAMARRYFDGVDPIGRSFSVVGPGAQPLVIVGVVGDVMTAGADPSPQPVFYVPYTQSAQPVMSMVVRVAQGDPSALAQAAEQVAWSLSRSCNVYAVETLDRRIADLNWRARFGALLLGGFSALALLLGAAGIYAVISYNVSQRRREIGVRMALGARARDVLAMVLGGGLRLSLYGIVLGGLLSSALTRLLAGSLYGVAPGDPATLAAVSGLLLLVAAGACLVPALRASRVDPLSSLRG